MKTVTIGRHPENDIVLDDPFVSAKHLHISLTDDGRYFLNDLGSSNGTLVNGQRVSQCYLEAGDELRVGESLLPWRSYFEAPRAAKPLHPGLVDTLMVGRAPDCHRVLDDPSVSARHAELLRFADGTVKLRDLGSTNGTFVNGQRLAGVVALRPGDQVRLGALALDWQELDSPPAPRRRVPLLAKALAAAALVVALVGLLLWRRELGRTPAPALPTADSLAEMPAPPAPLGFPELVAQAEKCVFLVENYRGRRVIGTGTGFFVSPGGIGVSNHHVFENGDSWKVKMPDGTLHRVREILVQNRTYDFVIFQVDTAFQPQFPYLELSPEAPRKGTDIFVVGNPRGIESTLSKGVVSALRDVDQRQQTFLEGDHYIQFDAAISPGSSGSPVMDMQGRVVGVATLKIVQCENCNFAINIQYLKNDLRDLGVRLGP